MTSGRNGVATAAWTAGVAIGAVGLPVVYYFPPAGVAIELAGLGVDAIAIAFSGSEEPDDWWRSTKNYTITGRWKDTGVSRSTGAWKVADCPCDQGVIVV